MICPACDYDDTARILSSWELTFDLKAESGNVVGSPGKGRKGWRYRKEKNKYTAAVLNSGSTCTGATGKRRLWITRLWGKGQRAFDVDNMAWGLKPLVDAIVKKGWLLDDTPGKVERIYRQEKSPSGLNQIIVRIEELDCA